MATQRKLSRSSSGSGGNGSAPKESSRSHAQTRGRAEREAGAAGFNMARSLASLTKNNASFTQEVEAKVTKGAFASELHQLDVPKGAAN